MNTKPVIRKVIAGARIHPDQLVVVTRDGTRYVANPIKHAQGLPGGQLWKALDSMNKGASGRVVRAKRSAV